MLWDERAFAVDLHLELALSAARAGDERGFAVLWRDLQPAMIRYSRIMAGEAAETVASRSWTAVARQLRGFEGDYAELRVWLFRLARHEAGRARRLPGRARFGSSGGAPAAMDMAWRGTDNIGAQTAEASVTDVALRLVAMLPSDQAEAVALRLVAGLDLAQTAQVLGVSDQEAQAMTVRGLRNLGPIAHGNPYWATEPAPGSGEQFEQDADV